MYKNLIHASPRLPCLKILIPMCLNGVQLSFFKAVLMRALCPKKEDFYKTKKEQCMPCTRQRHALHNARTITRQAASQQYVLSKNDLADTSRSTYSHIGEEGTESDQDKPYRKPLSQGRP